MITTIDEGKGLVKVFWEDVRDRVLKINPVFAKIIDELSPDHTFPIYLAYYPYGDVVCDTERYYLPKVQGGTYSLFHPDAPKEVIKDLGYGKNAIPFGMVLDKTMEYFVDFKADLRSVPWFFYSPGRLFPFGRVLSHKSKYIYAPTTVLKVVAGARSAFILPNIGAAVNHIKLKREFNVRLPAPKSIYDHWNVFKALVNSQNVQSDWRLSLMYFGEKWLEKLYNDEAWMKLKVYLYELFWKYSEYSRNRIFYDTTFSLIQKERNLKPNPYLADTARYMFAIALGDSPGYIPATDDSALPRERLQRMFTESYGLKYTPTILHPALFNFEKDKSSIYYSLAYPSTHIFSPKARKSTNTLLELRELEHITNIFREELSKGTMFCLDTIINIVAKKLEFKYFHNEKDDQCIIRPSTEIPVFDPRVNAISENISLPQAPFCSDSKFLRGCVAISIKDFIES